MPFYKIDRERQVITWSHSYVTSKKDDWHTDMK